jgi:hypothetical protein
MGASDGFSKKECVVTMTTNTWMCRQGHEVTTDFCPHDGSPRPERQAATNTVQQDVWICPNGHRVPGSYCMLDGTSKDAPSPSRHGSGRTQEPFIEILSDRPDRPCRELGMVRARVAWPGLLSAVLPARKTEDADRKLRAVAATRGADAVVGVRYWRGVTGMSWRALEAKGTAVEWD